MKAGGPALLALLAMRAWEADWEAMEWEVCARTRPEWKARPPSMLVLHLLAAVHERLKDQSASR
jgi:hypothetical protein